MNTDERSMIEGLFQRLQQAEAQGGPRDAEAERLIQDLMTRQPGAAYLLSQVVLVQEQGLRNLQGRVEELERELAARPEGGGGFLGGLFGGASQSASPRAATAREQPGWGGARLAGQGAAPMQPGAQGGFLAGALQTAMGVAGGVLLGNAIAGLFAGDAQAAEAPVEPPTATAGEPEAAPPEDEGGSFFDGFFGGDDDEGF